MIRNWNISIIYEETSLWMTVRHTLAWNKALYHIPENKKELRVIYFGKLSPSGNLQDFKAYINVTFVYYMIHVFTYCLT